MLAMTGRLQAFNLGESFAEHYGFTLLNQSHVYKIEYAGTPLNETFDTDQYRVEETARWFVSGFWGINASTYVYFNAIPESLGFHCLYIAKLASGARNLKQYSSCPNFKEDSEKMEEKVTILEIVLMTVESKIPSEY